MACAGTVGSADVDGQPSWRPATAADLAPGLDAVVGMPVDLGLLVDLHGDGRLRLVRVEVDDSVGAARVAVVDGPTLGELAPAPDGQGPVTSGLRVHPRGTLPVRDHMPADLVLFAAEHAVVEWCLPPDGVPWSAQHACYGSAVVGLDGDQVRRFEVWD